MHRRGLLLNSVAWLACGPPAGAAWSATPSVLKLLVGSPPGGPSDFMARLFAQALAPRLGRAVVVDNRPGASGMLAAEQASRARPDGLTLLVTGPAAVAVLPQGDHPPRYDPLTDLVPVCLLGAGAFVLVVHPSLQVPDVAALEALARTSPLSYASGGLGSSNHLCTELFATRGQTRYNHVPYKGDGQAVQDLLAGRVHFMFTAPNVAWPHLKSGRLQALAVTTRQRLPSLPATPSLAEHHPDFTYMGWVMALAPAGSPAPLLDQLHRHWQEASRQPELQQRLRALDMESPHLGDSRHQVQAFFLQEYQRLGQAVRQAGLRTQ